MIQNFIAPAIWGLLILAAFIGYGCLIRRTLFRDEAFGWANEAAWGMALVVMLGGILIFASALSSNLNIFLVLIGVLLMLWDKLPSVPRQLISLLKQLSGLSISDTVKFSIYLFAFVLAAIQYLHYVNIVPIDPIDEFRGYFIFPKQLLELGSFNVDPFDIMRLSNGLGGQSILHSLMLANSDLNNQMLVDGGVALLICVGLILKICSQRKLDAAWLLLILLYFLSFPVTHYRNNSSSLATGMVMLLALFAFLDRKELDTHFPIRNAFIVGLLSACACALKTTLIPMLVFTLAFSYLWHIYTTRFDKRALLESALVPAFVLLMLLPWMLTLYRTSGTMLWPTLGSGFDETNYGNYINGDGGFSGGLSLEKKWNIIFYKIIQKSFSLLLIATGPIVYLMVKMRQRAVTHAYIFGAIFGSLSILLRFDLTNTGSLWRYIFVFISIALLVAFVELASYTSGQRWGKWRQALPMARYSGILTANWQGKFVFFITAAAFISFFWYSNYAAVDWESYQKMLIGLREKTEKVEVIPEEEYSRHSIAQASVPVGEAIFSRDIYTLLYNYKRNKIFNANRPGGASPPPGMPYFQGPDAVASYLLSLGVRYVAYHYKDQAGWPVSANLYRLDPRASYLYRVLLRSEFALDHVLGELGYSRHRVYDDGTLFIIDLKTPSNLNSQYLEPNYFQQGKFLMLAWAKTRGFDSRKIWTDGHAEISGINYVLAPDDKLLVLNTFGYIPWRNDLGRLNLTLAVNGKTIPMISRSPNSYYFSLESITEPITNIVINSNTFDPGHEQQFILKKYFKNEKNLGIDVDTIQIRGGL